MTFVHALIERARLLYREIAKFGVVGALGFVVTEIGFNLLHFDAGLGLFTSNALATALATVVTFLGNKYWTYRERGNHSTARETVIFIALNAVGALIQYGCTWVAANGFDIHDKYLLNVALLVGIALGTLFRFLTYRRWVWAARAEAEPVEASLRGDLVRGR